MRVEAVFDRCGRHVLALGSLEDFLDPTGDLEQSIGAALATVAGAKEAIKSLAV
jgi:hypothetical protein